MNPDRVNKIKKFYSIAFKIKNRGGESGVTKQFVEDLITEKFCVLSYDAINRYYFELINSNFVFSGINGIKANENLEK